MNLSRGLGVGRGPALVRHDAPSERSDDRPFLLSKRFVWSVATIAAEALLRRQSNGGFREFGPIADLRRLVSRCSATPRRQPITGYRSESQYGSNRYLSNRPFDLPRRDGRGRSLPMVFGFGRFCWKPASSCRPSSVMRYPRVPNHLLVPASINLQPSRSESVLSPIPGDSLLRSTNTSSPPHLESS